MSILNQLMSIYADLWRLVAWISLFKRPAKGVFRMDPLVADGASEQWGRTPKPVEYILWNVRRLLTDLLLWSSRASEQPNWNLPRCRCRCRKCFIAKRAGHVGLGAADSSRCKGGTIRALYLSYIETEEGLVVVCTGARLIDLLRRCRRSASEDLGRVECAHGIECNAAGLGGFAHS